MSPETSAVTKVVPKLAIQRPFNKISLVDEVKDELYVSADFVTALIFPPVAVVRCNATNSVRRDAVTAV